MHKIAELGTRLRFSAKIGELRRGLFINHVDSGNFSFFKKGSILFKNGSKIGEKPNKTEKRH